MQLFRYMVFIWEDYEKERERLYPEISKKKDFKYPPILPIVFYDDVQNWTVEYLLNLVAQIVEVLLKKYNVPEKEIDAFSGQIKERHMGRLFAHVEAFDVQAVRKEARAEGISEGKTAGFIDAVHQLGGTMETAVQQLMILYGLNEEEAQEKVRLYW